MLTLRITPRNHTTVANNHLFMHDSCETRNESPARGTRTPCTGLREGETGVQRGANGETNYSKRFFRVSRRQRRGRGQYLDIIYSSQLLLLNIHAHILSEAERLHHLAGRPHADGFLIFLCVWFRPANATTSSIPSLSIAEGLII